MARFLSGLKTASVVIDRDVEHAGIAAARLIACPAQTRRVEVEEIVIERRVN